MNTDFIPYAQRFQKAKVEGKSVDDNYTIEIDGEDVKMHDIFVALRAYTAQKDIAVRRGRARRQRLKEQAEKKKLEAKKQSKV